MGTKPRTPKTLTQWIFAILATFLPALVIVAIFSLGAMAAWSALVRWLPTEEVAVQVIGSDSRSTVRIRPPGSSPSYWIKVVDENGLTQNISCIRETQSAVRSVGIVEGNLKLVRNPLFKTPVAFLRTSSSALKIDRDSALGKVLAAGQGGKAPPERFEIIKYPAALLIIGLAMLGGAFWMARRLLKIAGNRPTAIAAYLIATAAGTAFCIYWSSGLI